MGGGVLWQGMTAALWLCKKSVKGGKCASRRPTDSEDTNPPAGGYPRGGEPPPPPPPQRTGRRPDRGRQKEHLCASHEAIPEGGCLLVACPRVK